jgi:hypothetical protein
MPAKKPRKLRIPKELKALRDARTELAQAGQGDPKILAFKSYRDIPKCIFPLLTDAAKQAYDDVVRGKYDAGKLTIGLLHDISSYALQIDNIARAALTGQQPRGSWGVQLDRARQKLDLDDNRTVIAAPSDAPINRFAHTGFASRRR